MNTSFVVVTLFTPFTKEGRVDGPALEASVRFYEDAGVDGLFANCQTSETLKLTQAERLRTVETIAGAKGGLRLYSGVNLGAGLKDQAAALKAVRGHGADVPVIWLSTLPSAEKMDEQVCAIADEVGAPMGIYECPDPVHRLFSDDELERVARSGQFSFFKDTCRDNAVYARRMLRIRGSGLASYQANWNCLPASIESGSAGFSGWLAAARPDAVVAYSKNGLDAAARSGLHGALFELQEAMRAANYPASGKYLLKRRGLGFEPNQRDTRGGLSAIDPAKIDALKKADECVDEHLAQIVAG